MKTKNSKIRNNRKGGPERCHDIWRLDFGDSTFEYLAL